jgi:hypothetical protein
MPSCRASYGLPREPYLETSEASGYRSSVRLILNVERKFSNLLHLIWVPCFDKLGIMTPKTIKLSEEPY